MLTKHWNIVPSGGADQDGSLGAGRLFLPGSWFCVCSFHHTFSCVCSCVLVAQLCPTLCDPMDHSLPGSSVPGILQARMLEWVAMPSSSESSQARDQTWVFCTAGRWLTIWAEYAYAHDLPLPFHSNSPAGFVFPAPKRPLCLV